MIPKAEAENQFPQEDVAKGSSRKCKSNNMNLLRIIIGVLLPPVGVFMTVGIGPTLLINILLTVLGWLPGSIHALWVIVKQEENANKQRELY